MNNEETLNFVNIAYKYYKDLKELKRILGSDKCGNTGYLKYVYTKTINGNYAPELRVFSICKGLKEAFVNDFITVEEYNEYDIFKKLLEEKIISSKEYKEIKKRKVSDLIFHDYNEM